jgi:phage terminase large subunit-like protein
VNKKTPLSIDLNPKQKEVYENVYSNPKYREFLFYGAARSGKTMMSMNHKIGLAINYPGISILFIRKSLAEAENALIYDTLRDWERIISEKYKKLSGSQKELDFSVLYRYNKGRNVIEFKNGSEIMIFGTPTTFSGGSGINKLMGKQFQSIVVDEAWDVSYKDIIEPALSRLNQRKGYLKNIYTGRPFSGLIFECLENPAKKTSWTYKYFHQKINPLNFTDLSDRLCDSIAVRVFTAYDNLDNVDTEYYANLVDKLTSANKKRFVDSEYQDGDEDSLFPNITWENYEDWLLRTYDKKGNVTSSIERICIYVDPSYKSGIKNDFKAVATVGIKRGNFYILNMMAERTTTDRMVEMIHESQQMVYKNAPMVQLETWVENAGLADDFNKCVEEFRYRKRVPLIFSFDKVKKGNKYDRIESELVPLHKSKRLHFNINEIQYNRELKSEVENQFINFCKNPPKDLNDDIPDSVQGAVSKLKLDRNFINPTQVKSFNRVNKSRMG